jgi:hypothetical protein
VFLCGSETVLQVRDDIQSTIQLSQQVTMDEIHPGLLKRLYRALLRVLAPLL